jgi:ribosomal protein S18 acetylase RimI-like enzyme
VRIRPFQSSDEPAIVRLWQRCDLLRPWNDPKKDIQRKLSVGREMFLVGVLDDDLVATVMVGYEGHRGWVHYLAVAPEHRGKGLGRALMTRAEELLKQAGCPKVNLQVRGTNASTIEFYERLGYAVDDVVSLGKRLETDERA